jgi:hypothetical protein
MPTSPCVGCGQLVDGEELFCPHCGAATIPQMTAPELRAQLHPPRRSESELGYWLAILFGFLLLAGSLVWAYLEFVLHAR